MENEQSELIVFDLKNVVPEHVSNADGDKLFEKINAEMKKGNSVRIGMQGVPGLNTSFVNSAFIQLLEHYSFDYIKDKLTFTKGNKQVYNIIKSRFHSETKNGPYVK